MNQSGGGGGDVAVHPTSKISTFVTDILKVEPVETAYNLFLLPSSSSSSSPEFEAKKTREFVDLFRELLSSNASASTTAITTSTTATTTTSSHETTSLNAVDAALRHYVSAIASSSSAKSSTFQRDRPMLFAMLLRFLEAAVKEGVLSPRQVCDVLLSSDHLKYENETLWIGVFGLVGRIINGVDYKGVREIMKICIEKVLTFPKDIDSSVSSQLTAIHNLLNYIFDRKAALLPGYFIVNEILKSYPENRGWPHWKLIPMMSSFLNSFRHTAQMVSCIYRHRLRPVVEHYGKAHVVSTWKLDSNSLKILLKGNQTYERILPYSKEMTEPQRGLLLYILRQPYSKELAINILGLQKPRKDGTTTTGGSLCPALEEQLVTLFLEAMAESENGQVNLYNDDDDDVMEMDDDDDGTNQTRNQELWRNLSSELIFFILFLFVNFPNFINVLYERLAVSGHRKGRDELLWALLQYISGSMAKNLTPDFVPVLRLISLLYDDKEPLPLPDLSDPRCVKRFAATATYIHLAHRAQQTEETHLRFALPRALRNHHEFLTTLASVSDSRLTSSLKNSSTNEYFLVATMCNTYSTQDCFQLPMGVLMASIGGGNVVNCEITANEPLPMEILDSLSVHSKMSLIHSIVTFIQKQVNNNKATILAPALIETYSRLLVYPELESLGIKGLLNQLLPTVFKQGAWSVLHVLLEIFSYRLHHIQSHFRLSLLNHLQQGIMTGAPHVLHKHAQLNLCIESTTLKLITGLGNAEVSPPKNTLNSQGKPVSTVLYGESEELNRVVVLTLARAIHIYGLEQQSAIWVKDVLTNIMTLTPHSWPSHTLSNFPPILQDFFKENPGPKENKAQLKSRVEEEYKTWTSMSNEHDIVQHFSNTNNTLFLCVFWKMLLETDHVTPIAYKVLERIGAKTLTSHLRSFCDMLVCEFSKSGGSGHVTNCIDALNNLIWKYKVVSLDRLILCMALRTHEGNEAQVCFFIIQLLLLKPQDFRNRVSELVRTLSPEHQLLKDFHSKHLELHQKFPEKFGPDDNSESLPIYFSNVCLRFVPVFDIVVHRFLELPPVTKSLETLIDHVGVLYKFHARPITYLYNTLHYYEKRVRDRPSLKKMLLRSITGALKDIRPNGWCLTEEYLSYLSAEDQITWNPNLEYFVSLIGRLAKSLQSKNAFPQMDYRFNEFPNEGVHAMYVTCVEVMGLPMEPSKVGEKFLEAILESHRFIDQDDLPDWINAVGIIISNLPEAYWEGLHNKLVQALTSPPLSQWNLPQSPFRVFNFQSMHVIHFQHKLTYLLALSHSVWHHAGFNQIQLLPDLVRDKFLPVVKTEEQLLFIYHLMGPFLQRLHSERYMRPLFDLTVSLYRVLNRVDKECKTLKYIDPICDILYHVKYQFTGDSVKSDAERIVRDLRPALQLRLRFIAPGILQQAKQTNGVIAEKK